MQFSENICFYVLITCMLLFVREQEATDTEVGIEQTGTQEVSAQSPTTPQGDGQGAGKKESVAGTSESKNDGSENSDKQQVNQKRDENKSNEAAEFFGLLLGGPPNNVYDREFKEQKNNHSNRMDSSQWNEKIFMANAAFEEGDHPVFLVVGGLSGMDPKGLEVQAWFQLAKKFEALIYFIEHRFYGSSFPGVKKLDTDTFRRLLSTEQSIMDIATFINSTKQSVDKRPFIVFGQGYGGTLAAWFRMKQAHQVIGAVVLNAPMVARAENKDYYEFFKSEFEETVKNNIKEAYTKLHEFLDMLISENTDTNNLEEYYGDLKKKFNMCEMLKSEGDRDDNVTFMFWSITTYLAEVVKFKISDPQLFEVIMKMLVDTSITDPLDRFGMALKKILHFLDVPCLAVDYQNAIDSYSLAEKYPKSMEFGLGIRQTFWLSCSEYGQFPTSDGTHTFGEKIDINFYESTCNKVFYTSTLDLARSAYHTNVEYGGKNIDLQNLIYISNGDKQWNDIGITESKTMKRIFAIKIEAGNDASELQSKYDTIVINLRKWLLSYEEEKKSDEIKSGKVQL